MNKDFIDLLISGSETTPPQTQEQKLQDSINALTHRMEENFNSIQKEIDNIKNEREGTNNEENPDSKSKERNGQEEFIQNDTVSNNDND